MFSDASRGISSEVFPGDDVATVGDPVIELGDSSSTALPLKRKTPMLFLGKLVSFFENEVLVISLDSFFFALFQFYTFSVILVIHFVLLYFSTLILSYHYYPNF